MKSILVTRMDGLGDIVLGTSLLRGLHERWPDARIVMVVRPQMRGLAAILPGWVEIVTLPFDPRAFAPDQAPLVVGALRGIAAEHASELCILAEYNRVWAGEILVSLCDAQTILSFDGPLGVNHNHRGVLAALQTRVDPQQWFRVPVSSETHELQKYAAMLFALSEGDLPLPAVECRSADRQRAEAVLAEFGWSPGSAIVCFPSSGDLLDRSLDAATWAAWLQHLAARSGRRVLLLGGGFDGGVLEAIRARGLPERVEPFTVPHDDAGLLTGLLATAAAYIGADTGPAHIAAVLGRPTLAVFGGGHRAHRFLPIGPGTMAVRMPLGCYGCEWNCPFERRRCLRDIPLETLLSAGDRLLEGRIEHDPRMPEIVTAPAPAHLHNGLAGALSMLHRRWLELNHRVLERDMQVAELGHQNAERIGEIGRAFETFAQMTTQNGSRDEAIQRLYDAAHRTEATFCELTSQNRRRDEGIQKLYDANHQALQTFDALNAELADVRSQVSALRAELEAHASRRRFNWLPQSMRRTLRRFRGQAPAP